MPPAASSTAYPGRGCMETGYVDGCRWFGDRTKGPLAAVHESVSLIDCARIFSRLRRKPVKLDQKVTGICPTGASARDCANSAPAVDTMTPLPNFDPIAVGDEVAGLSSKMIAVDSIGVQPERMRKLRALAVTTANRPDALPDLPTVGEFVPGYEASPWWDSSDQ